MQFAEEAVDHWLAGAAALQEVSDRVICFVHPVDRLMTDELKKTCGSDILTKFAGDVSEQLGISTISWEAFDLGADDFLDINHMNAHTRRANLSRQLARTIYSE